MSFHPRGHDRPHQGMSSSGPHDFMFQYPPTERIMDPFISAMDSQFDILQWYPKFQSCVTYFLDHAQYDGPVQAMAAFINIQLPNQNIHTPIFCSRATAPSSSSSSSGSATTAKYSAGAQMISLTPYIRRLVATGFDFPGVLHGFFGDDWVQGIGQLHEVERRNYLFAAKASNWLDVKAQYDMPDGQSIPFLRALQNVTEDEIVGAETNWSQWLAMQDWMLGPRNPEDVSEGVKGEDV